MESRETGVNQSVVAVKTQAEPAKVVMTAGGDLVLADGGEVYTRKRPLSRQPLFWVSLALGLFSLIVFSLMNTYWMEKQAIEAALHRNGFYYDAVYQDIYSDEEEWTEEILYIRERLKEETLLVIEEMEQYPANLVSVDVNPALDDLEVAVKNYAQELSVDLADAYDLGEVTAEEYLRYTDKLAQYEEGISQAVTEIRTFYRQKEKRPWTIQEEEDVLDHLYYLLDPDAQIFDELDSGNSLSV